MESIGQLYNLATGLNQQHQSLDPMIYVYMFLFLSPAVIGGIGYGVSWLRNAWKSRDPSKREYR